MSLIEAMSMPRSMGTAKQAALPTPAKVQAWNVSYTMPVRKQSQVTAQSEAEVRRMVWEYLRDQCGRTLDAATLTQMAKAAQIKPANNFDWAGEFGPQQQDQPMIPYRTGTEG